MATTKTTPLDHARIAQIAQSIRGAVTPFLGANAAKIEAGEAFQASAKAEVSLRETIMASVAELSQTDQWTEGEVSAAAAKAAAMSNNDSEKALATFIGETKRAMHPKVRAHVPALMGLRDLVWDSETEMLKADKDSPKPCRKAFARKYHMLMAMMGAAQEGKVLATAEDVLRFAETNDPDLDVDKVLKRLATITEQLVAFQRDWPVDDIGLCVDALNQIDKKALKASRPVVPTVVVDNTAQPVAPATTVGENTPAVGAVDVGELLDDVLEMAA